MSRMSALMERFRTDRPPAWPACAACVRTTRADVAGDGPGSTAHGCSQGDMVILDL
jgi:hypothetical protein